MTTRVCLVAAIFVAVIPYRQGPPPSAPLWPGAQFKESARSRAIARGLQFIYRTSLVPANFNQNGPDYMWCFYELSTTARDPGLRAMASAMAHERTRAWRRENHMPSNPDAETIVDLVNGSYTAELLGFPDPQLKEQLRHEAARFTAKDFLTFDPRVEPAPADVPHTCEYCNSENPRGATVCHKCGHALKMRTRYDVMFDALITSYTGDSYGVILGASYRDVLHTLPALRPYLHDPDRDHLIDMVNVVTHVVYTLNDYQKYRLLPAWLPYEFGFLKERIREQMVLEDGEILGEFLDTLKSFGLTTSDDSIRVGYSVLLATQNPDGSWGDMKATDIYDRYHPTWTAIDGLRDYAWEGERLSFPELLPMLEHDESQ
jgi:hypothetical protein